MGDVIHALPAVASLRQSYPQSHVTWAIEPRWAPLLSRNPSVDRIVPVRRDSARRVLESLRDLRMERYHFAVDFQGLLKSALVASLARPRRIFGFHHSQLRERAAGLFYSDQISSATAHVVDRNLDLARSAGASRTVMNFPLPPGQPEGDLPPGDFVLASPLAGWRSKQWPAEHYATLASRLRRELAVPLVLNAPPDSELAHMPDTLHHSSGLPGLIHATRRAAAVIGVDSGPMHLAAALGKAGVAIFGPTDPARNGPYGGSMRVLRSGSAVTTYKRGTEIDESMRQISPDDVFEVLRAALRCHVP